MRTAYLDTLFELASHDRNVYAVISDNGAIVYDKYRKYLPDQFINAGISEANMVAMSAGMAERGKIPFAYTIGAFLAYRAYEFILNDVCMQQKNVKLVGIGAGCSYSLLGASHHTVFDLSVLRSIPELMILSPSSPKEVSLATKAAYEHEGPVYLRLGTNNEPEIYPGECPFTPGRGTILREGNDVSVIGTGSILKDVLDVADSMRHEADIRVINIHTIKPLDEEIIVKAANETGKIITVEEHSITGGLGSAAAEVIAGHGLRAAFRRVGVEGFTRGYGSHSEVMAVNGIGRSDIAGAIRDMLR